VGIRIVRNLFLLKLEEIKGESTERERKARFFGKERNREKARGEKGVCKGEEDEYEKGKKRNQREEEKDNAENEKESLERGNKKTFFIKEKRGETGGG